MTTELGKRIITSVILFIAAIFCILIHLGVFYIALFAIAYLCFDEWRKVNYKYFRGSTNVHSWKYFIIKVAGFVYLFTFYICALALRGNNFESTIFFIIILCICICSDIGGYVFGKFIGGKRLTKISPNKTIAGSIGSFIFSLVPAFLFYFQSYIDTSFYLSQKNILLCLFVSLVCQLGDLLISYFKRLNKVKNTGTILPGHGGLLDRVDGIIFAIPAVYVLKVLYIF